MSAVALLTSICTGHGGFPPRLATSASTNTFIEGIGVHCVGDTWAEHSDGHSSHSSVLATGSPKTFLKGLPVGRVGDAIACGSLVATGANRTEIG
jgi:uncharacterized Zn-binding protein involved in type VI secretion